ncbi:interferon gamma isoform X1 [Rousettus aegyptiacus]|uniref:interferon gamma isoform X1 n=1 Tax=Rousettus aegyptiacus TaxID=9407 RepID=UPI00168D8A0A|nr:interferon gamma isoform X1 [Rousettus aegyptiacus]XP_036093028.1 interferon gamma isoform X1 [Rousettus aegyptiacus]XP_036093029.1 interferon gamma isoform X1 [Rousettus aegyptiacus]
MPCGRERKYDIRSEWRIRATSFFLRVTHRKERGSQGEDNLRGCRAGHTNASNSNVADGGTLFLDILKNWREESDKKIIQSQIVSFYFKLFEKIQDNPTIQSSVQVIKEDLRVKFFNSNNSKLEDFKKVIQIPVNNQTVLRKAISELFNVLTDLSPKSNLRKRKRSQSPFRGWKA